MLFGVKYQPVITQYEPQRDVVRAYFTNKDNQQRYEQPIVEARELMVKNEGIPETTKTELAAPLEWQKFDGHSFNLRWISDFPQATYILKQSLKKLSQSTGKDLPFKDLRVLTGPITKLPGFERSLGGYVDPSSMPEKDRIKPIQIIPGVKLIPPFIFIDTIHKPSVAEQISVIVHEYWHYIYVDMLENNTTKPPQVPRNATDDVRTKKMLDYLADSSEYLSHLKQAQYLLGTGMNKNEVVQNFIDTDKEHGVSSNDMVIVRRYYEIVSDAEKKMQESEAMNEDPRITKPSEGFLKFDAPEDV